MMKLFCLCLVVSAAFAQTPGQLLRRGMDRFQEGKVEEALADFDQVAKLDPTAAPHLWQRGIAQYYAGRFADCKAMFESHRTVNPEDVENSAWHYLCTARAQSPAKARQALIPVARDGRPPMMTVLAMFGGKATPDDVLRDANRHDDTARFFAYLYIGLYWEANGDQAKGGSLASESIRGFARPGLHGRRSAGSLGETSAGNETKVSQFPDSLRLLRQGAWTTNAHYDPQPADGILPRLLQHHGADHR